MKPIFLIPLVIASARVQQTAAQDARPAPAAPARVEVQQQADRDNSSADVQRARAKLDQAASQSQQLQDGAGSAARTPSGYMPLKSRLEKGAWLGLLASPPPPALRHQLKLPEGTGLVVDFVQPRSPAQQAGIRQYDLLVKLNDQLLINAPQLGVLVRTFKPSEEVRLVLLREGQRQTVPVTLVEHELPPLTDDLLYQPMPDVRSIPAMPPSQNNPFTGRLPDGSIIQRNERSLTWLDGKRQITVSLGDGNLLTVSDSRTGRIMFKGTLDSLEKQAQLPDEVRDVLDRVKEFLKAQTDKPDESVQKQNGQRAK